jgi:hypothetical protein
VFQKGDMDEEIYVNLPQGLNGSHPQQIHLGLVQAARQWNDRFEEVFKLGFKKSNVDPCLSFKREGGPFCVIMLITNDENLMKSTIENLERVFKIQIQ